MSCRNQLLASVSAWSSHTVNRSVNVLVLWALYINPLLSIRCLQGLYAVFVCSPKQLSQTFVAIAGVSWSRAILFPYCLPIESPSVSSTMLSGIVRSGEVCSHERVSSSIWAQSSPWEWLHPFTWIKSHAKQSRIGRSYRGVTTWKNVPEIPFFYFW